MTFAQLFRMSRERLLVANDTALKGHLIEFKDHDLLQTRCPPAPAAVFYKQTCNYFADKICNGHRSTSACNMSWKNIAVQNASAHVLINMLVVSFTPSDVRFQSNSPWQWCTACECGLLGLMLAEMGC